MSPPSCERVPSFFLAHSGLGRLRRGPLGAHSGLGRINQEEATRSSLGTRPADFWPLGLKLSLGFLRHPSFDPWKIFRKKRRNQDEAPTLTTTLTPIEYIISPEIHDSSHWEQPGYRRCKILQRGVRWCVGVVPRYTARSNGKFVISTPNSARWYRM